MSAPAAAPNSVGEVVASWQCWDGAAWIDTHHLVRAWDGGRPETVGADSELDVEDVHLDLPSAYPILVPDVAAGTYRISDQVIGLSGGAATGFVVVEVVVEPEPDPDETVVVTSTPAEPTTTTRPEFDSVAFDVGPLAPRTGHTVVWTGEEVIVWGGTGGGRTRNNDGAAFTPGADTWREIAVSPLQPTTYHFATWTAAEMLVVSGTEAAAYDPGADSWRSIAAPPFAVGGTEGAWYATSGVWTGSEYVVSAPPDRVIAYSPATDAWSSLPPIGLGWTETSLRWAGDTLYAFGIVARTSPDQPGQMLRGATFDGSTWVEIPSLDLSSPGVASDARHELVAWVGDRFVAWSLDGPSVPAFTYTPGAAAWVTGQSTTVRSCEGGPPPLEMGTRVFISSCLGDSIYDGATDTWTEVNVPGEAGGRYTVWTGEDILYWGDDCCSGVPAWRYEP
jgi:hypothetical protein